MDLRLPPANLSLALKPTTLARPQSDGAVTGMPGGFTGAMKSALHEVSAAQNQSVQMQREVQMENPTVSLEDTMVAIQKAQIGFQATLHVRNRMVQAYTDIMNMQV
ncbi:MAG: flagellar hook-basal body complex protein FliE [Betaproteobacteria bacterium]